ncbi:MAG: AraC family transcriptional regulator [Victivallaceae bacterium]|nr:AraC family transcriptional regulator [Victivallaceae bacterium]
MSNIPNHYLAVSYCTNFSAPATPISPCVIPAGYEKIELITGGKIIWGAPGEEKIYGRGAIFWHLAGEYTVFKTFPDDPYRCQVIDLRVSEKIRVFPRVGLWRSAASPENFFSDLIMLMNESTPPPPEVITDFVIGFLGWQQSVPVGGSRLPEVLRRACGLLAEQLASGGFSIDGLAARCGVSRTQIFRLFKTHLGVSPYQYMLKKRLDNARTLLRSRHDLPVKLVAEMCGFNTIEVFYRQFKQFTGSTPAAMRK